MKKHKNKYPDYKELTDWVARRISGLKRLDYQLRLEGSYDDRPDQKNMVALQKLLLATPETSYKAFQEGIKKTVLNDDELQAVENLKKAYRQCAELGICENII